MRYAGLSFLFIFAFLVSCKHSSKAVAPAATKLQISAISPSSGYASGGTSITLLGTGFVAGTKALVNGVACNSTTYVSATSIRCLTAAAAAGGPYPVSVKNPDATTANLSSAFTFVLPPAPLSYSKAPFPYAMFATVVGMPTSITPTFQGGTITDCSVTPALPTGLSFSSSDCSISGTATVASTQTLYLVTVETSSTTATATFALGVSPSGTAMLTTSQSDYVFIEGQPLPSLTLEAGGGTTVSNCANNSPPAGLSGSSCTITGTPSTTYSGGLVFLSLHSVPVMSNFQVSLSPNRAEGGEWLPIPTTGNYTETFVGFDLISSLAPNVSYGENLYFAQASLTVGSAMEPIVPTNAGGIIAACASSPPLPAGLVLSQDDCSVSGTPTTALPGTQYTLTPSNNSATGNALSLNLSIAPNAVNAMACQSDTLCTHAMMPLWDQSDPKLTQYINTQYVFGSNTTKYNVPGDMGWCGGVSGAMILSSYFQEVQNYTGLQSTAIPTAFASGDSTSPFLSEYPFIFQSMKLLGTDISNGGTPSPNNGMINMVGQCTQTDLFDSPSYSFPYNVVPYNSVASYRQGMPLGWLAICTQSQGIGNCHAVAVNGVDGGYFTIYDPWGTVFSATIGVTFPAPQGNNGVPATLSYVSGNTQNFTSLESNNTATILTTDWISGYVYTNNGPPPSTQCVENTQL